MMRRTAIVVLTLFMGCGSIAFAQAQQHGPTDSIRKAAADPNERICKDITLGGSRVVTKRFCGTRAEWEAREQQDRDEIVKMQRPMQCNVMGMGGKHC